MSHYRKDISEGINFVSALTVSFAVFSHKKHGLPLQFAGRIRRTPSVGLGVHAKNVSSTLRSGEITNAAVPVFGLPKRCPHFGGEGYSRGTKTDPVFVPSSPQWWRLKNEAFALCHEMRQRRTVGVGALDDPLHRFEGRLGHYIYGKG